MLKLIKRKIYQWIFNFLGYQVHIRIVPHSLLKDESEIALAISNYEFDRAEYLVNLATKKWGQVQEILNQGKVLRFKKMLQKISIKSSSNSH